MKCPHCTKESKAKVLESRQSGGKVWRLRLCGLCLKNFVTTESAAVGQKFPWKKRSRATEKSSVTGDGKHLQEVWR